MRPLTKRLIRHHQSARWAVAALTHPETYTDLGAEGYTYQSIEDTQLELEYLAWQEEQAIR